MRRPGYLAGYTAFGKNYQVQSPPPPSQSEIVAAVSQTSPGTRAPQPSAPSRPSNISTPAPQAGAPRSQVPDPVFAARIAALRAQLGRRSGPMPPGKGGTPSLGPRPAPQAAPPPPPPADDED